MKTIKLIDQHLEAALGCIMLAAIVALVMFQVITRYILAAPPSWIEEAVGWIFVWCIWIGISYGFKCRAHIRITLLSDMLPENAKAFLAKIIDVMMLAFFAFLFYHAYKNMTVPYVWKQTSVVLNLPIPLMYASSTVGCLLVIVRLIQNLFEDLFGTGESSHAG